MANEYDQLRKLDRRIFQVKVVREAAIAFLIMFVSLWFIWF